MMTDNNNSWHLRKRIPISLFVVVLFQAAIGLWWAASLSKDMEHFKLALTQNDVSDRRQWDEINSNKALTNDLSRQLGVIEGTLSAMSGQLSQLVTHFMGNKR